MDYWVTGLGLVCPSGNRVEDAWGAIRLGRGIATDWCEGWRVARASWNADAESVGGDRSVDLALVASREACLQAHLQEVDPIRVGCSFSSSKGGVGSLLNAELAPQERLTRYFPHVAGLQVREDRGFQGPVASLASACATGAASLMQAAHWIERGECDAVVTGATESALVPLVVSGFGNMRLLSRNPDGPAPFDRDRDGFRMGEGAAALVLENAETARARGALPLARLAGWQLACDPASPLELDPSADPVLGCANAALRRSGLKPGEVDYVNAHGTGTRLNDRVESLALRKLFGSAGGPWVSSTKGATGHLLGAAAAVEAVLCVKALQEGWAPPTVGLKNPDLDCALQHVPPGGIQGSFRNVISLNYGLGGHLATLVFSKP